MMGLDLRENTTRSTPSRLREASGTLPPSQASGFLEEVLVTAQKRVQNIQDVPFAVSALTGEALQTYQYKDFRDLYKVKLSFSS